MVMDIQIMVMDVGNYSYGEYQYIYDNYSEDSQNSEEKIDTDENNKNVLKNSNLIAIKIIFWKNYNYY